MRLRAKQYLCLSALALEKIGNVLPEIDLWCFAHNPRIHQLLPIGKIAQALQPERDKELLRSHKGIGRTAARRPRPDSDQVARMGSVALTADHRPRECTGPLASA